jgi:hypothetical protein
MTVFWDVAPCNLVEVYRRFRKAVNTAETSVTYTRLHGATSWKIVIFKLAAVRI